MVEIVGLVELSAAIAIIGGAFATAIAQKDVLSAAVGAVAEDPKNLGKVFIFVVLPETILIFSMVVALVILAGIFKTA